MCLIKIHESLSSRLWKMTWVCTVVMCNKAVFGQLFQDQIKRSLDIWQRQTKVDLLASNHYLVIYQGIWELSEGCRLYQHMQTSWSVEALILDGIRIPLHKIVSGRWDSAIADRLRVHIWRRKKRYKDSLCSPWVKRKLWPGIYCLSRQWRHQKIFVGASRLRCWGGKYPII